MSENPAACPRPPMLLPGIILDLFSVLPLRYSACAQPEGDLLLLPVRIRFSLFLKKGTLIAPASLLTCPIRFSLRFRITNSLSKFHTIL